ncbi:MAG TPA: helix-turn-helix domain-containing protein [Planctomycetia bacterium]|nr:helix-turn-helix domain-containing protein [Planctomycetia bacterium]
MRPLVHPSIDDVTVEGILHALSDPLRAALFARIVSSDCSHSCSQLVELAERTVPKSTLSQHFKALREAGLAKGIRRGNEVHHASRCMEIEGRFPGLLQAIIHAHHVQLKQMKKASAPRARSSKKQ